MNAARAIEDMGASVSLVCGKVKVAGLDRLDKETAVRVLDVARSHRAELLTELAGGAAASPGPSDHARALAEVDRFFATAVDDGAGGWADPGYLAGLGTRKTGDV